MLTRLKALGLALVAVLAMSAMASSVAHAGEIEIFGGAAEATVTGEQIEGEVTGEVKSKNELKVDAGPIKCTPVTFHGVAKNNSKELTLTPVYGNTTAGTGCTIAGLSAPIVHMNGCDFLFTLQAGGPPTAVEAHVICPVGQVINITVTASCTITVSGGQTFASSMITGLNAGGFGSAMDVNAIVDIAGIDYVEHSSGGVGCPNGGGNTTTTTNGIYKGVVTLKGDAIPGSSAVGVTIK